MRSALRKMGNSTGIIVPKPLLSELGASAGQEIDLRVVDGTLVAAVMRDHPRAGWAESAAALAAAGEDALVWPEFANEGDDDLVW